MNDIRSLLAVARQRLEMTRFIDCLHRVAVIAAVVALVIAIADRLPAEGFIPWMWVGPVALIIAFIIALVVWAQRRLSELQVAMRVDERLDLREKLSTALHCSGREDAFALAAVDDAVRTARDKRTRETVRRRFDVGAPRRWWMSPLFLVAVVAVLMAPNANLFADDDPIEEDEVIAARIEAQDAVTTLVEQIETHDLLKAELGDAIGEMSIPDPQGADPLREPEQVRRDALKRVTDLNRRLDDLIDGEKGKTAKALESMMARLRAPEDGRAKEFADAMAKGDFAQAKNAIDQMMKDLADGGMDEEAKQQLADQMQDLAEQLEQMAKQQQQLANALEQAGLNPQLANNPQALQEAIQQAQNLNQQQKQQLQQMVNAQQQAQQMCKGMGGACQMMAQAMQGQGQMGQGQQQAMQQLSQMEAMQQMLQQAQAMAGQCQSMSQGLGQGLNMQQMLQKWQQGGGMGQWGQGQGGKAPIAKTPTGSKMEKAEAAMNEGQIIARTLVDGVPIRGESKARLKQFVETADAGYDEAIAEDPLPRIYHETLKHYFGELQEQVEAIAVQEGAASAEPATESATESE